MTRLVGHTACISAKILDILYPIAILLIIRVFGSFLAFDYNEILIIFKMIIAF